jgi:hypothetical protein
MKIKEEKEAKEIKTQIKHKLLLIYTNSFINRIKTRTKRQNDLLMFLFFSPFLLSLSGCIGMNSKFDCNAASGGKCEPMGSINKMADYGVFQNVGSRPRTPSKTNQNYGYPLNTFAGQPIRSNESIQQIWIGPYEDTSGNYHEPSYVYVVIKKGKWFGEPANVIQD